jgi:hypothetical protein
MIGVINANGIESPFLILSVASYSDTFGGMLSWEPTMIQSLNSFIPTYTSPSAPEIIPITMATTSATSTRPVATTTKKVATTTPVIPTPPAQLGFRDEVVSNHDVRVYRDAQGMEVIVYGYWDPKTLIIAHDETAFSELIGRLATSRTP